MDRQRAEAASGPQVEPVDTGVPDDAVAPPSLPRVELPEPKQAGWRDDLVNVARGFCMGAADTVPGVSGGTVALILGHYRRLITAVSHVDARWLRMVRQRQLGEAARYIDLRFLITLGIGIVSGALLLAGTMHWLLENRLQETLSVFLGLILASAWIVARNVDRWEPLQLTGCVLGIAGAVAVGLLPVTEGNPSPAFLFLAGAVAICAMILPGISGAFVLLLLGAYHHVTGLIKQLAAFDFTATALLMLAAFAVGCGFGLLAFSKFLRWLLERHRDTTMATLLGLMIGSLSKLWPLQVATAETAELEMKFRRFEYVSPAAWEGSLWWLVLLAALAAVAVIIAEMVADRLAK